MLGMFNLLPLLEGWEYKFHRLERTAIVRGATPIEKRLPERGWLMNILVVSSDCYGTLKVTWQGADLQIQEFNFNAEAALALGAVAQDPAGWVQRYFRPNPASTAGIFVGVLFSGGSQGSVWPYVPTVIMEISLPETSTQVSAYVSALAITVAITNSKLFKQTLQEVQGFQGLKDEIAKMLQLLEAQK